MKFCVHIANNTEVILTRSWKIWKAQDRRENQGEGKKKTKKQQQQNHHKGDKDMMTVQRKCNTKMIQSVWSSCTGIEVAYFMRSVLKTDTKGKLVKRSILFSKFPAGPQHPSIK